MSSEEFCRQESPSPAAPHQTILSLIRPGALIFDVGANVGAKTRQFVEMGARVVCVEPQPQCAHHLRSIFENNQNVAILEMGLAAQPGTLPLSICEDADTISTFSDDWKKGRFADYQWNRTIDVPVTTLDALIARCGVPDFVKIDVEGFEGQVVGGLSQPVPLLCFEWTIEGLEQAVHVVAYLQSLGYREFNVATGESEELALAEWVSGEVLLAALASTQSPLLWGDIYARADVVSHQQTASPASRDTLSDLATQRLWAPGTPLRLHLGCGETLLPGYVNIDYPADAHNVMDVHPDFCADITRLSFAPGTVDEIRLHHVLEHFGRVGALAQIIKWQEWLKPGGTLHIETPDLSGSARTLSSDASWATKMGTVRHLAGDQAAPWAYHIDHWFPERFTHTLSALGFDPVRTETAQWPQEPFLSNVTAIATKARACSRAELLAATDALLWESTVSPAEKNTYEVWCRQLRAALMEDSVPAPTHQAVSPAQPPSASLPVLTPTGTVPPLAEIYDYNQQQRDRWVAEKARAVPIGSRVLDIGAGTAPYRGLFNHCSYQTHDFKQYEGVKLGNTHDYADIDFVSDVAHIPAPDASFDVILCTEVLEHVPEPIAALREMARLLRPGGSLLITAPLGSGLHQLPFHFYGGYTPQWYEKFCAEFGLRVTSITPNGGFFKLLAQECARFAWTWDTHKHLHGAQAEELRVLFGETLPRYLFALDDKSPNTQFTAGYFVEAVRPLPGTDWQEQIDRNPSDISLYREAAWAARAAGDEAAARCLTEDLEELDPDAVFTFAGGTR